jgi:hypothetical protein
LKSLAAQKQNLTFSNLRCLLRQVVPLDLLRYRNSPELKAAEKGVAVDFASVEGNLQDNVKARLP